MLFYVVESTLKFCPVTQEVVGVLTSKGDGPGLGPGMSTDDRIFIPLSLQKRLLGTNDLRLIAITARDSNRIPEVLQQVKTLLALRSY